MSSKYNYSKSILKNIPFFALIFLLLILVFFSGCVSFCAFDESKECVSYSEAIDLCTELSSPINNYPICSSFGKTLDQKDCEKVFSSNISSNIIFSNLSIESQTLTNNYRYNLIESWKSSDKIVYDFSKINSICEDFFDKDYLKYRDSLLDNTKNLDYYTNEFMFSFITSLFSVKKDLLDKNILLMQDTKLYLQYIELNNVINEFIKATGKEVDVKESLAKDSIEFYFNYYSTTDSKKELQDALLTLNKDISFESNIFGWSTSMLGLGGLIFTKGMLPPIAGIISSFSLTKSITNTIASYYQLAILKSNLSEWNKFEFFRDLLKDFEKSNGKNAYSHKSYLDLLKKIDFELNILELEVKSRTKNLDSKLTKIDSELSSKLINKDEFAFLYSKYNLINSPNELFKSLESIKLELSSFPKLSLGEKHSKLNVLEYKAKELEDNLLVFEDSDLKSLITLCTADLTLEKQSFNYFENENKVLLDNYLNLFFKTSNDREKLLYCTKYFELKENSKDSCSFYLKNLSLILNENVVLKDCDSQVKTLILKLNNSELYSNLKKEVLILDNLYLVYSNLYKHSKCISYNSYYQNTLKYNSLFFKSNYSEDRLVNIFLYNNNFAKYLLDLDAFSNALKIDIKSNLNCYFNEVYELDNSNLLLPLYLGDLNIDYEINFKDLLFSNVSDNCISSFDIDKQKIKFTCLENNMVLDVKQNFLQSSKIKSLDLDLDKLSMVQEVCLINSKIFETIELGFDKDLILTHNVSLNGLSLSSNLGDNLTIYFNFISNKKICIDVSYLIDSAIIVSQSLDSISGNNLNYTITVKNNLGINLEKLEVYIPNIHEVKLENISFKGNVDYGTKADKIYFKLDLMPLESKNIAMVIKKDYLEFSVEISNLEKEINNLEKLPWISKEKILELRKLLESLKSSKDSLTMAKNIVTLKTKIDSLLSEAITNSMYDLQRKDKINLMLNYKEQFNLAKVFLLEKYNISLSNLPDFSNIDSIISQSNELFSLGKIKESLKILDNFDFKNKELELIILGLFESKTKEFNELKKSFKEYSLNLDESNIQKISNLFNSSLKNYFYFDALKYIDEYYSELNSLNTILDQEKSKKSNAQNRLIDKYKKYKSNLDLLWSRVLDLDSQINSSRFSALKDLKIILNFTIKDFESLKTNISKLTKQTLNLDLLIKEKNISEKIFLEFFYDYDVLEKNVLVIENELKNTAKDKLVYAKANLKNERDYLQARDYYDSNAFIDSIYFSGLAILGSNNKDYSLYIGIGFIILLAFLVYFFGKKYTPRKEVPKETYYSLDRED